MTTYYVKYPLWVKSGKKIEMYNENGNLVGTTQRHQKNKSHKLADVLLVGGILHNLTNITTRDSNGIIVNQAIADKKWIRRQTWKFINEIKSSDGYIRDKSPLDLNSMKRLEFEDNNRLFELKVKMWTAKIYNKDSKELIAEFKKKNTMMNTREYLLTLHTEDICIFTIMAILHIFYTL
jgi:hypothetical protein